MALLPQKASAFFFQAAVNGPTVLPAGVTTLAIDGGPTYYADNSFTNAATAATSGITGSMWNNTSGWDDRHFIPIGAWLELISGQSNNAPNWPPGANDWLDLGLNTMFGQNGGQVLSILGTNKIWLVQASGQPGSGVYGGMVGTGLETVGNLTWDESLNWEETVGGIKGFACSFNGTMVTTGGPDLTVNSITSGSISRHTTIIGTGITGSPSVYAFGPGMTGTTTGLYGYSPGQNIGPEAMSISLAGVPNSIQDQRFWWANFQTPYLNDAGSLSNGAPFSTTPQNLAAAVATPSGTGIWATRHLNMAGFDSYAMSGADFNATTTGNFYGIINWRSFSSLTIGAPPYTTASFIVNSFPQPLLVGATVKLDDGGTNTITGTINTYNSATGAMTLNATAVTGSGTIANWNVTYHPPIAQTQRPCIYGDWTQLSRSVQRTAVGGVPAPCYTFLDPGGPWSLANVGSTVTTPEQLYGMVWATLIHGARWIVYFLSNQGNPNTQDAFFETWARTIQTGEGISRYNGAKALHRLIQTLAPVINSPFAVPVSTTQAVTVSSVGGAGKTHPFQNYNLPGSQAQFYNDLLGVPPNDNARFECVAKWYAFGTEVINGVTLTQNRMWVLAMYRGNPADTNIVANFTLAAGTVATSATKFYTDGVIGAASNGAGGTRITCRSSSQIQVGDTARIMDCSGTVTIGGVGINNSFTVIATGTASGSGTFDIAGAFAGSLAASGVNPTGFGVVIIEHPITVTAGAFSDTFPNGNCVGIYRMN